MWDHEINTVAGGILARPQKAGEAILLLGASDTGKTTFAVELARRLAQAGPVAFVDADIGQSRIGPPTTVGWALMDDPQKDFSQLETRGIFFVGAVSPVGHLLQFTSALVKCVKEAAAAARIVIIDTPGFVADSAATSLWWAVQEILRPTRILLLQRNEELRNFVGGIKGFDSELEFIKTPLHIPQKSIPQRQAFRQQKFEEYFRNSLVYRISLRDIAVQARDNISANVLIHRIIALRDSKGIDLAIGVIVGWDGQNGVAAVQTPAVDINKITCIIIGDVLYESNDA
jgi:polynucleotide 5'-hydroxyl-kinase GRC3/NOL9